MNPPRRTSARVSALWLAVALAAAPGCTQWDDWLPGTPFTPDQPEGAVTLVGTMNSDPVAVPGDGCTPGGTVFWGQVRNTGDVDVTNVAIVIDVFDGAGGSLGTYRSSVFNGDVDNQDPDNPLAGTSLAVDKTGTFTVCTPVPFGAAARTEYRTSFTEVEELQ